MCSAPTGLAGQLSRSLSEMAVELPWSSRASQGQNQVRGQVQVQVSFGAANRIESDREWIRQDRRDPFSTLYPCDLIGSPRWLLGDFVTGYFNGTRWEPSIYSFSLREKQVKQQSSRCCTEYTMGVLAAMTKKRRPWYPAQHE